MASGIPGAIFLYESKLGGFNHPNKSFKNFFMSQ